MNLDFLASAPWGLIALVAFVLIAFWAVAAHRRIVETNTVHIVQSQKKTTSYGTGKGRNVYLAWPSWLPIWGVTTIRLPVNNFDLSLNSYLAYDKDRVPFHLDITAFFRIKDTNIAAERISSFQDLEEQLQYIVKGVVRKILATHDIHTIMLQRSAFGDQFTAEVAGELQNWGVEPVKNIELMDIRDADGSQVIANIMAKKTSQIEMESRVEVAQNKQRAAEAEINAQREVDLRKQEAVQQVGQRTAQQEQAVGISKERAKQEIQAEARTTKEREMAVLSVDTQRRAEIAREAALVAADQQQKTTVIHAEGDKQQVVLEAEGGLEAAKREAEGKRAIGIALADAEKAMQLAPVQAQIELAKEIGQNDGYQTYLIEIRKVEAVQVVGVEQAKALEQAEIKVIANAGSAASGIASIGEILSSKGGQQLGAMLEGLAQTPHGKAALDKLNGDGASTERKAGRR